MKKQIIILALVVLLVGVVVAVPTNITSLVLDDFVAGGVGVATFSFDYLIEDNLPEGSLVLRVNMSSLEDEENCPLPSGDCSVWKGDFFMSGYIEQFPLFGFFGRDKVTPLQCLEENETEFYNGNGLVYTHEDGTAGTFYCYDPSNYLDVLDLGRRDEVTLEVSSHYALYPGEYGVSVELMEMELDSNGPIIELVEPSNNSIFSETNKVVSIKLNITDMYNIDDSSVKYKIVSFGAPSDGQGLNVSYYDSGWIYEIDYNMSSELYEADFNMTEHNLNESGSYWIYAEAKDILGNLGKL